MTHSHDAMTEELYRETILDHNANPRNKGPLDDASFSEASLNPSCGDRFTLHVKLSDDGTSVETVRFEGIGCAISTASMSLFSEKLTGMSVEDVRQLDKQFVYDLLGVPISVAREKCALVSLKTAQTGLRLFEGRDA